MNIQDLLTLFKKHPQIAEVAERYAATKENIHLKGMEGSLRALVFAALYEIRQGRFFFVLNDVDEAAFQDKYFVKQKSSRMHKFSYGKIARCFLFFIV